MKHHLFSRLLMAMGLAASGAGALSASDLHMVYPHYSWMTSALEYNGLSCLPKAERLKSYAGHIVADYDENLSLEMRACARLAVDIWESEIRTQIPIRLKVVYAPLESPKDAVLTVTADVSFQYDKEQAVSLPSSLYKQLHNEETEEYDAVITINSDIPIADWSYTVSTKHRNNLRGKYNLTTAVLRAIGNALGIGSGIDYSGELPCLALPALTPYDKLITFGENSDASLADLDLTTQQPSEELAQLLTENPKIFSDTRYSMNLERGKKLDTPAINFSMADQYMYTDEAGLSFPCVDTYTKMLLKSIGWESGKPAFGIYPHDSFSDTGILTENKFWIYDQEKESIICSNELGISYYRKDGSLLEKKSLHEMSRLISFELPDDSETDELETNVNGDIYGYVSGHVTTMNENGNQEAPHSVRYRLSIQQPPVINSIKIMSEQYTGKYMLVTYQGAESIAVKISDNEGNTTSEMLEMPYNAIIPLSELDSSGNYTISLLVGNNKGVCKEEVFINANDISIGMAGISDVSEKSAPEWNRMEVYDLNGRPVADNIDNLPRGIYIVVYYNGASVVKRDKVRI